MAWGLRSKEVNEDQEIKPADEAEEKQAEHEKRGKELDDVSVIGDTPPNDSKKGEFDQKRLYDELSASLDKAEQEKIDREKLLSEYNQADIDQKFENGEMTEEERRQKILENKKAINDEINDAGDGPTVYDRMSFEEKLEMHKTNPDRYEALERHYQDRHPHGLDEDNPDFNRHMMVESLQNSRKAREKEIEDMSQYEQ